MRYIGEVRFRFVGAPTTEKKAAAQGYVSYGRKLLGLIENRDMALGLLPNTSQRDVLPDGTIVTASISYNVAVVTIDVTGSKVTKKKTRDGLQFGLRWEPEGLMLTPKTAAVPGGYGLPRRSMLPDGAKIIDKFPLGTPNGFLPQVLLNRFSNNKYHDDPRVLSGGDINWLELVPDDWEPPQSRFSYATETPESDFEHLFWRRPVQYCAYSEPDERGLNGHYIFASGGYVAYSSPGVRDINELNQAPFLPQDQIVETETNEWFAHRPEEVLATSETRELVWYKLNEERLKVGEVANMRGLRGEQNVSDVSSNNLVYSKSSVQTHDYPEFTPGMRTAASRVWGGMGMAIYAITSSNPFENVAFFPRPMLTGTPEENAETIVQGWVSSPGHYAAMISPDLTKQDLPLSSQGDQGTVNATVVVGTNPNFASYKKRWVYTYPKGPNYFTWDIIDLEPTDPPDSWQNWVSSMIVRPSWLPTCSRTDTYALGTTGMFGSSCPYTRNLYLNCRSFVFKSQVYAIPQGNELPGFGAARPFDAVAKRDKFMSCLGCAPFEKMYSPPEEGAPDEKQVWLRGVYWRSDTAYWSNGWTSGGGVNYLVSGGTYPISPTQTKGELVVLVWPEGLGESAMLPWAEDELPKGYDVEFTHTFTTLENWLPNCEGLCRFDSTGTKFILELERAHPKKIWGGLKDPRPPFSPFDQDWPKFPEEENALGFISVQRVPILYEDKAFTILYENTPIEAKVDYEKYTFDVGRPYWYQGAWTTERRGIRHHNVVKGEHKIYPHFDANDDVQFCRLVIDEQYKQFTDPDAVKWWYSPVEPDAPTHKGQFEPFDPKITDDTNQWGYRQRKLIFPSGKEFVYMQQYMVQNFSVGFADYPTKPEGYDVFPGNGENFNCIIFDLDERTERVIYAKHTSYTYCTYQNLDPLGTLIPDHELGADSTWNNGNFEGYFKWSWTRGDSSYHLDMGSGDDRVEEVLASYPGTKDTPMPLYQWLGSAAVGNGLLTGHTLYMVGSTPFCYSVTPASYIGTSNQTILGATVTKNMSFGYVQNSARFAENSTGWQFAELSGSKFADMFETTPIENYYVSVTTRPDTQSEMNTGGSMTLIANKRNSYYGNEYSGSTYHNVAPQFTSEQDGRAKFVQYKDRWVCRLELRHISRMGPHLVKSPNGLTSYQLNYPYDASGPKYVPEARGGPPDAYPDYPEQPYLTSLIALDDLMKFASARGNISNGTKVHLKANFDLDEATGIDDIIDIQPFGVIK